MQKLYTSDVSDVPNTGMPVQTEINQKNLNAEPFNAIAPEQVPIVSEVQSSAFFHDTQGTIEVNGGGQLQYTLPIALPPGIKSVAPQVNLIYTSGSGNGIAGYGWNLSGVSGISRMGRNVDKDGETRSIQFDYSDYYMFNGQRLTLQSGTYGKDGATYATEKYSNVKVRSVSENPEQNGPAYFEVTFEDGSQAWYGSSADARTPMEYNIVRWEDAQGNYILYAYIQGNNVAVIDRIDWGGNETVGIPYFNTIIFNYIQRDVVETSYVNGKQFVQMNLLDSVEVRANNNLFKTYTVAYSKDDKGNQYQFLKSITERNSLGEAANPVVFDYKKSERGEWKQTQIINDTSSDLLYGDFNGDGKIDILKYVNAFQECVKYEEIYHVAPSTGQDDNQSGYWESSCVESVNHPAGIYLFGSVFDDIKPKQVHVGTMITKEQLKKAVVFNLKNAEGEVLPRQGFLTYEIPASTTSAEQGRKDLVLKGYSLSTDLDNMQLKEEFVRTIAADVYDRTVLRKDNSAHVTQFWQDTYIREVKELDLDGDGVSELIFILEDISNWQEIVDDPNVEIPLPQLRTEYRYRYLIVRPGETDPQRFARMISMNTTLTNFFSGNILQGDFNGDGCVDFITFDQVGRPYLTTFKKDTYGDFYSITNLYSNVLIGGLKNKAIVGDFTGDGKTDLLIPQALDSKTWKLHISTGVGFKVQTLENFELYKESLSFNGRTHDRFIDRKYFAQDLNKDGKADFIGFYSHIHADHDDGTTTKFMILYHENKGIDAHGNVIFEKMIIDNSELLGRSSYKDDWYPAEYNYHWTKTKGFATNFTSNTNAPKVHYSPIIGDFRINNYNENILVIRGGTLVKYAHYSVADESLISAITQGGIKTEIKYDELDPNVNPGFYAGIKKEQYPYVELDKLSRTFVVSQLKQENRKQDFKYRGFVAHVQGKGLIGFRKSARSSWYTDSLVQTKIWSGTEMNPLNEGLPIAEWTVRTSNDDQLIFPADLSPANTDLLSFKSIGYQKTIPSPGVTAIVPVNTVSKDFLQDITEEYQISYGAYYLPSETTVSVNNGFATTHTVIEYSHNPGGSGKDYFIGRPTVKTETVTAYGDIQAVKEEYFYDRNLLQARKTYNRDTSGWTQESYGYDGFGNITEKKIETSVDATIQVNKTQYDAKGRFVIKRTDNLDLDTTVTYNDWGQVLTEVDALGNTLTNTYDGWGKMLSLMTNLGGTTTFTYEKMDDSGTKTSEFAPDGMTIATFFNKLGQEVKVRKRGFNKEGYLVEAGGFDYWVEPGTDTRTSVLTAYDELGRKIYESEPYHEGAEPKWNSISYDDAVFPPAVSAVAFNGKQMTTIRSGRTTVIEERNGYLRTTRKTTDPLGNVISSEDKGGVINFSFNAAGQQVTAQYENNIVTTAYDTWGRKSTFDDQSNGKYQYAYNGFGQPIKVISPKGYKEYHYNAKGQLIHQIEKSYESGLTDKEMNYSYNDKGLVTGRSGLSKGKAHQTGMLYDTFGRLTENKEESYGRVYAQKNIVYDDQSRVVSYEKSLTSGGVTTKVTIGHVYDPWSGILQQVKDLTTGKELWRLQESNASGQLVRGRLGVSDIQNSYDSQNLLSVVQHKSLHGNMLHALYTFDAVRNELKERSRAGTFGFTETFAYDDNNRLIEWSDPKTGSVSSNIYDVQGRITAIDKLGTVHFEDTAKVYRPSRIMLHTVGKRNYSNDQIQKIRYNENNDPIYIEGLQGDVRFEYGLSAMRQLVTYGGKATNSENVDPVNSQWEGQYTKFYSADGSFEVIRNNTTGTEKHLLYIGGSPYDSNIVYLKDYSASDASYRFLHKDYLGSILAISDEAGVLVEERHFDAWGNLTHGAMAVLDRGYTSHEHFAMIGIIHMNGRLYDPTLRRFLNADENIQDMFNTQNYNKYGYVMNNPLLYNDPSGEFFFAFLGVWAFWQAVIIGAAIGLASYTVGLAVTGNIGMWSLGGALRATLFGAVSGAATYGIGSIFTAATNTFGNALLQAGAHSVSQGVLSMMQGQNFLSSIIGGMVGSLAASGWGAMMKGVGLGQFSQNVYGMVTFSTLSGGVGAELAGGNFWKGAIAGGIVAGLNHAMHKLVGPGDDQYSSKTSKKLTQKEFNEYIKQNRDSLDEYSNALTQAGAIVGAVPTDLAGWRDFVKDLIKFKLSAFRKIISIRTFVGTQIYLTGKEYGDYSKILGDVKYNYDKMHGNAAGMGVRVDEIRVHIPYHGGVGTTIFEFYDVKSNKYLGGGSL